MGKSAQEATDNRTVKKKKSFKRSAHSEETSTAVSSAAAIQLAGSDQPIEDSEGVDNATKSEDRKARKKALKAARGNAQTSTEVNTEAKKGKKRKNLSEEGEDQLNSPAEKPPKKRRKNRTEFVDPRDDEELNDQSRRGTID